MENEKVTHPRRVVGAERQTGGGSAEMNKDEVSAVEGGKAPPRGNVRGNEPDALDKRTESPDAAYEESEPSSREVDVPKPQRRATTGAELKQAAKAEGEIRATVSLPTTTTTFDERLRRKMESESSPGVVAVPKPQRHTTTGAELKQAAKAEGEIRATVSLPTTTTTFDERLRRKMESESSPGVVAVPKPRRATTGAELKQAAKAEREMHAATPMPTNFNERLSQKMDSESLKRDVKSHKRGEGDFDKQAEGAARLTHRGSTNCFEETPRQKLEVRHVSLSGRDEGTFGQQETATKTNHSGGDKSSVFPEEEPKVLLARFDEMFAGLEQFKSGNGNLSLPASHPSVQYLFDSLSSLEIEPFMRRTTMRNSEALVQGIQHSEHGRQESRDIEDDDMQDQSRTLLGGAMPGEDTEERPNGVPEIYVGTAQVDKQASRLNLQAQVEAEVHGGGENQDVEIAQCQGATGGINITEDYEAQTATVTFMGEHEARNVSETPRERAMGISHRFLSRFLTAEASYASETSQRRSMGRSHRFLSRFLSALSGQDLIEATLVEDVEEGEVVTAQPVGYVERKWKMFASATSVFLIALLAVGITVFSLRKKDDVEALLSPTFSPTFDLRPTLEIVQERGKLMCAMKAETVTSGKGLYVDLCRSVAAVVLGNPDSFVGVPTTWQGRWYHLLNRSVDLAVLGDTYTIERETRESNTGSGFTFSTTYNYDGMIYAGNETLVHCAEESKRFGECLPLKICVELGTTWLVFLRKEFPHSHLMTGTSMDEVTEMLFNDTCNVLASEKAFIQGYPLLYDAILDGKFIMGNKLMSKEPYSIITRNTDREFSDIVNWVVQALLFGEERGLSKNATLCRNYTDSTLRGASELDFMNGVSCVGNYAEINSDPNSQGGINDINDGAGMLYAIPFRNIENEEVAEPSSSISLAKIMSKGSVTCGVVVPETFAGDVTTSDKLVGMSVDYCRTLSAAIFVGDSEKVNFLTFTESDNSSIVALANGTLDVLAGARFRQKYDFAASSSLGGLHFSTPYFYGNEPMGQGVSFYSMATLEDDVVFASFVNCVVMATIHAQENGIQKHKSKEMPLASVFGSYHTWALRDAIAYSGSYDEIYSKHFGSEVANRGRNALNEGGPLMLSFLNLSR